MLLPEAINLKSKVRRLQGSQWKNPYRRMNRLRARLFLDRMFETAIASWYRMLPFLLALRAKPTRGNQSGLDRVSDEDENPKIAL